MFKYLWGIILVVADAMWAIFAISDILDIVNVYRGLDSNERKSLDMWDCSLSVGTIIFIVIHLIGVFFASLLLTQ